MPHQDLKVFAGIREHRYANRDTHLVMMSIHEDGMLNRIENVLCTDLHRLRGVHVMENDCELVSAETGRNIVFTDGLLQPFPDLSEIIIPAS